MQTFRQFLFDNKAVAWADRKAGPIYRNLIYHNKLGAISKACEKYKLEPTEGNGRAFQQVVLEKFYKMQWNPGWTWRASELMNEAVRLLQPQNPAMAEELVDMGMNVRYQLVVKQAEKLHERRARWKNNGHHYRILGVSDDPVQYLDDQVRGHMGAEALREKYKIKCRLPQFYLVLARLSDYRAAMSDANAVRSNYVTDITDLTVTELYINEKTGESVLRLFCAKGGEEGGLDSVWPPGGIYSFLAGGRTNK